MKVRDLTVGLLPKLEDVESAIEINRRERKRLFTIRRLILDGDEGDVPGAAPLPAPPKGDAGTSKQK